MGCVDSYAAQKETQLQIARVNQRNLTLKRQQLELTKEVIVLRRRVTELCDALDDELVKQQSYDILNKTIFVCDMEGEISSTASDHL